MEEDLQFKLYFENLLFSKMRTINYTIFYSRQVRNNRLKHTQKRLLKIIFKRNIFGVNLGLTWGRCHPQSSNIYSYWPHIWP